MGVSFFSRKFKIFTTPLLRGITAFLFPKNATDFSNSFSNKSIKYLPVPLTCTCGLRWHSSPVSSLENSHTAVLVCLRMAQQKFILKS